MATFFAVAATTILLPGAAFAQSDPDCASAGDQYRDCDETEVTVVAPPEQQPPNGFPGGTDGVAEVIIGSPESLPESLAGIEAGPSGAEQPAAGVSAPADTASADAASVAATQPYRSVSGGGTTTATLPDTGGEGWLFFGAGAAMISLAVVVRKLFAVY